MRTPLWRERGLSVIELLLALVIFGIVIAIASSAIVQYLRLQSDQEAVTTAQTKLRRVTEFISQELRGSVLGGVTDFPYAPSDEGVSLLTLSGGGALQATTLTNDSTSFLSAATTPSETQLEAGDRVVIVGTNGQAVLRRVSAAPTLVGSAWQVNHPACTLPATPLFSPLLFEVSPTGYRYDRASRRLLTQEPGDVEEKAVAFNLSDFRIDYIYEDDTGVLSDDVVYQGPGFVDSGVTFNLKRLQVVVATQERSRGRAIERTYSTQIELARSIGSSSGDGNRYRVQPGGVTLCP